MLAIERKNQILEKLRNEQHVVVAELSQLYAVTEETIRRDLDKLEKDGFCTKTYGGAILGNSTKADLSYTIRNKTNVEAKKAIAVIAASHIQDGDHIMLDDSSTSLFLAKEIKEKKRLTVITNSIQIIMELADVEGFTIMSTGGTLKPDSLALIGYQAQHSLQNYHVDKAFISCKGISLQHGVTDSNENHSLNKKAMLQSASETFLCVDSSKFDKVSFVNICDFDRLQNIITEALPGKEWLDFLKKKNIRCQYETA